MITSFTEILELPNFGDMTTSTMQFGPSNKYMWLTSSTKV